MRKTLIITLFALIVSSVFPTDAFSAILFKPTNNLGLVGHWSFDEGSGSVVSNRGGRDVGSVSGASWVAGRRDSALDFDGVNDFVLVPHSADQLTTGGLTLSAWIRADSIGETAGRVMHKGTNVAGGGGWQWYLGTTERICTTVNQGTDTCSSNGSVPLDGAWRHVALTVTAGGSVTHYVNGVSVGTGSTGALSGVTTTYPLCIGNRSSETSCNTDRTFDGGIDEARMWGRVLSATEIMSLYGEGVVTRKMVSSQGLLGYWPMNEGVGTVVTDMSGSGNHGAFISTPLWSTGKLGPALDFDGSDDGLLLPMSINSVTQGSMTVSAWSRFDDDSRGIIFGSYLSTDSVSVEKHTSNRLRWYWNDGEVDRYSPVNVVTQNRWHHLTFVRDKDASQFRMYVDGTLVDSVSGVGNDVTSGGPFHIGRDTRTGTTVTNGKLDEVRVYSRALSTAEITALYSQGSVTIGSPVDRVSSGLAGYWSFNGKDMDWAGNSAVDQSGQGRNVTLTNMSNLSAVAGKMGQGLSFNGSNQYASTTDINAFDPQSGDFSAFAWIYPNNVSTNKTVFSKLSSLCTLGGTGWALYTNGTALQGCVQGADGAGTSPTANGIISANVWQHVGFTWTASTKTMRSYHNGVQVALGSNSNTVFPVDNGDPLTIGSGANATSRFFNGRSDDVRIYGRALSADEARQLYLMGK